MDEESEENKVDEAAAMHVGRQLGGHVTGRKSWASIVGGNLPRRNDKNDLKVTVEKEARGSFTERVCTRP